MNHATDPVSVAAAELEQDSMLHFVRTVIALRQANPALGSDGDFKPVFAESGAYPFVFERFLGRERFWVAVNPSGLAVEARWNSNAVSVEPLFASGGALSLGECCAKVTLGSAGFGVWRIKNSADLIVNASM